MKTVEIHGEPSFSADGRKAQVIVLIGEGSNCRSMTRHAVREKGLLVGLNPDPRAIELNDRYEEEFAKSQSAVSKLEAELTALSVELEQAKTAEVLDDERIEYLVNAIEDVEVAIQLASADLNDADVKLRIVQQEFPRRIAFVRWNGSPA